jgi:hypothetical protein
MSKPSHSILGPGKSLVTEERAPFTKTEKVPLFVYVLLLVFLNCSMLKYLA